MKHILYIIGVALLVTICSCRDAVLPDGGGLVGPDSASADSLLELTQSQADSLEFRLLHHYTNNFNFLVRSDTLCLLPLDVTSIDTVRVNRGDVVAVADIRMGDTVWVKVARDQLTMGWLTEDELLTQCVPDDLISQLIDWLSGSRLVWMSAVVLLGVVGFAFRRRLRHQLQIFRFDEMDSPFSVLLPILVSIMACLYSSIQMFAAEFWQEYYFHPTLNPLILPPVMATLVALVWLVAIVFLALIIDVYHHFYFFPGITYLLEMLGVSMVSYLLISWTTQIYVGYPILAAYVGTLVWIYFHYIRCPYVCGQCGNRIRKKGICPHCQAVNK